MIAPYDCHFFVCTNEKEPDKPSCKGSGAIKEFRRLVAQLGVENVRVNMSGCLGRCKKGPALVIYPQDIWYRYETIDDLKEIAESQLLKQQTVDRLLMQ